MVGPHMNMFAAQRFYKAMKVYPNTMELVDIYKKTVPEVSSALPVGDVQLTIGVIRANYDDKGT